MAKNLALATITPTGGSTSRALGDYLANAANRVGSVSIYQFLSPAQQADAIARTRTLDMTAAFQACLTWMATHPYVGIFFPAGDYGVQSDSLIFGNGTEQSFNWTGRGATIYNFGGVQAISTTTTVNTTIPNATASAPGHIAGSCLIFTTNIYYITIEYIQFDLWRFAVTFLGSLNSPTFKSVFFNGCNVGVLSYQTSQNTRFVNCTCTGTNVMHCASCVAYPNGSLFASLDNIEMDGLFVGNVDEYGIFAMPVNAAFDTWFQGSILQPTIQSYSVRGNQQYLDASGTLYGSTAPECLVSGRVIYAPFRNGGRACFNPTFNRIDMRGASLRGVALINTAIDGLYINTIFAEGVWSGASGAFLTSPWFEFGSTLSGTVINVQTEGSNAGHNFIHYTNMVFPTGTLRQTNLLDIAGRGNILLLETGQTTGWGALPNATNPAPSFTANVSDLVQSWSPVIGQPAFWVGDSIPVWRGCAAVLDANLNPVAPSFTVAALPSSNNSVGAMAFATNARVSGEGSGSGTGSLVIWNGSAWQIAGTNVTALA